MDLAAGPALSRAPARETCPDRGSRRERWWRATRDAIQTRGRDYEDDPASAEAHRLLGDEWVRARRARQDRWRATRREWPSDWQSAVGDSTSHVWVTAEEAAELSEAMIDLVSDWFARTAEREGDPAYRPVEVQLAVFPTGRPPQEG